jgi:hypothetical protein
MTVTWLLALVMGDNKIDNAKNAGKLLAILITIGMRQCKAGCITQWNTSRAVLHWISPPPPTLPSTSSSLPFMCDVVPADANFVPDGPFSPLLTSLTLTSLLRQFACVIGKGWGGGTA